MRGRIRPSVNKIGILGQSEIWFSSSGMARLTTYLQFSVCTEPDSNHAFMKATKLAET